MRTVFDMAQSRLKAVEKMDRILARQREQKAELEALREEQKTILLNGTDNLHKAVSLYEAELIRAALKISDKSIVGAARLLGVSYQYIQFAIESRHPELLPERSKIVRRKVG